jgi:hypothetical protein
MAAQYEVLKAIFSTAQIAIQGKAAHKNVARRAQPETSSNQL